MHNLISPFSLLDARGNSWHKTTIWGLIAGLTLGGTFGSQTDFFFWQAEIEWGLIGMLFGIVSVQIIKQLSKIEVSLLTRYAITLVFTLLSLQSWQTLSHFLFQSFPLSEQVTLLFGLLFCPLLGWQVGILLASSLTDPRTTGESPPGQDPKLTPEPSKLLDSSSIIDGRILSLCKTGFLQGRLLVPKCILQELQLLADSPHPDKRIRGKRGLEILSQLRTLPTIELVIPEENIRGTLPVDEQLLTLATTLKGLIITNDWNLAQIANLQGLTTLNINELTYELRPLILPGQTIRVFIQKEGQSPGQGAAHLDDGTLVIIDHGRKAIGQIVEVEVTRYMQTNTGRMIFASLTESLAFKAV
ncbi:MAG: TRAM domain-containing protein [Nitrospirales bacterium]|nr:TRAM domain-containing protein [Nitrospirales bacterium]